MSDKPDTRIEARGKPGAEIIARLEQLRRKDRLGIHMWERRLNFAFPEYSADLFTSESDPRPMISASLMPALGDFTMEPFADYTNSINKVGYLLDLDEQQLDPVQVIAAKAEIMRSGNSAYEKRYDPEDAARSLDQMVWEYRDSHKPVMDSELPAGAKLTKCNEVVLHAKRKDVRTIVVSDYPGIKTPPWYQPMRMLSAAMAGLSHAEKGWPLPIVSYRVTPPEAGKFEFIGETARDLNRIAADALNTLLSNRKTLNQLKARWEYKQLILPAVKERFGIDLEQPLVTQRDAIKALREPGTIVAAKLDRGVE